MQFTQSDYSVSETQSMERAVSNCDYPILIVFKLEYGKVLDEVRVQMEGYHNCSWLVHSWLWVLGADPELAKELGFEQVEEQFVDEYKSTATLYRHKKTGAEIMSVVNDDENKVFGIVFRTPP
jgi:hypothetical protein